MKSWLTTHYPHPDPDSHPWDIYLQREHKDAVKGCAPGDRVFFYEYKKQKPVKGPEKFLTGRQGIVRVAYISGEMYQRPGKVEYADGTTCYWNWGVPTAEPYTEGFVALEDLLAVIKYKPGSVLFGFNGGTGVMQLSDSQDSILLKLFRCAPARNQ